MGIRGLMTYIFKHADIYLENYELKDTCLVIDGCCCAGYLYRKARPNDVFGRDYDKFRKIIIDFFEHLEKCNVTPICIFDGGFEYKKLKTLRSRMKNHIQTSKKLNPSNQDDYELNPLLHTHIFKETLRELNIKIMVCDFDADFQIVSVARSINCPVLSYDSDFYLYDCLYIPLNSLDIFLHNNLETNFIDCKLYKIENLLNHFGGLNKSLLPLMATILINDYLPKNTFDEFFIKVGLPSNNRDRRDLQRTIETLLNWLRSYDFQSAREKILSSVQMGLRSQVDKLIDENVAGYNCSTLYILNHFGLTNDSSTDENSSTYYTLLDTSDNNNRRYEVPYWFITKVRTGMYSPAFISLIVKQIYSLRHQMEDVRLRPSHHICCNLVKVIFGLLTSPTNYRRLSYITRDEYENSVLVPDTPIYGISGVGPFPPLDRLPSLTSAERKSIFDGALRIHSKDFEYLNLFPESWRIVVVCIIYWARAIKDIPVTPSHLYSLILSLIYIKYIDEIVGFYRSEQEFKIEYQERINVLSKQNQDEQSDQYSPDEILESLIKKITEYDALLTANNLIHYFSMDETLRNNPENYSIRTVHCFAEFQAVYCQIKHLNGLLDYPFRACNVAHFYNGTFIYNLCTNFQRQNDPNVYLNLLLGQSNSVLRVINKSIDLFHKLLPRVFTN